MSVGMLLASRVYGHHLRDIFPTEAHFEKYLKEK